MVPPMLTLNYVPSENEGLNFGQNTEAAVQFLKKFTEDSIISVSTVIPDGAITTESFKPDQLIPSPESRIYKLIEKNQGKSNIYFSVTLSKHCGHLWGMKIAMIILEFCPGHLLIALLKIF